TKQIQAGKVERVYRAVVRGDPKTDAFAMDAWLAKDARTNEVRAAPLERLATVSEAERRPYRPPRPGAAGADRFPAPLGACASLDVRPITGRSHQIRVHLAGVDLPIIGDPKYGALARGLNRPLLHAMKMSFLHPRTRKPVVIEAPIPWEEAWLR